jgi:hypothetical protein
MVFGRVTGASSGLVEAEALADGTGAALVAGAAEAEVDGAGAAVVATGS